MNYEQCIHYCYQARKYWRYKDLHVQMNLHQKKFVEIDLENCKMKVNCTAVSQRRLVYTPRVPVYACVSSHRSTVCPKPWYKDRHTYCKLSSSAYSLYNILVLSVTQISVLRQSMVSEWSHSRVKTKGIDIYRPSLTNHSTWGFSHFFAMLFESLSINEILNNYDDTFEAFGATDSWWFI